jgi:hypothetical protein
MNREIFIFANTYEMIKGTAEIGLSKLNRKNRILGQNITEAKKQKLGPIGFSF